jgi:hypothetical protein
MTASMSIGGTPVPIGEISLHFQSFLDDGPPHAWLDIHSRSDDSRLGGLAINCLDIGDIANVEGIFGREFFYAQHAGEESAELTESVFWGPGDDTLEIISIRLRFGVPKGALLPIEIFASCTDHNGNPGIDVSIAGDAVLARS